MVYPLRVAGTRAWGPSALPERHVPRADLVRRIRGHRVVAVVAPGGYGKSVLALEVAAAHLGEVVLTDAGGPELGAAGTLEHVLTPIGLESRAGPPGTATADRVRAGFERRRTPILLVVDEVGASHWPAVRTLADAVPAPHRLLVLGRAAPDDVAGWRTTPERTVLDERDLRFTAADVRVLVGDPVDHLHEALVDQLLASTGGWVTALQAVAAVLVAAPSPALVARELLADNVVLGSLVDRLLRGLPDDQRTLLARAATLPALDAAVARSAGLDGVIRRAHAAGLPWQIPSVGAWTVADPIAEHLARGIVPDPAFARTVAAAYAAHRQHLHAVTLLRRHGLGADAAAVLAEAPTPVLRQQGPREVARAIAALPPAARSDHPEVEVQRVRMLSSASAYQRRNDLIAQLVPDLQADHPQVVVALEAERFRDLAYYSPDPDPAAAARIRELLGMVGGDHATRARLEEGLALLVLRRGGPGAMDEAAEGLRRAADAFELAGDSDLVVLTLRNLAWHVHLEQGRLDRVLETFDQIDAQVAPGSRQVAVWRINRAEAHLYAGQLDRAAADLAQAAREAELHHNDLHLSYAAWTTVVLESMREEAMRTLAAVGRADRLAGDWFDTTTGALYLGQTTDALARVGLEGEARQRLQQSLARRDEDPVWADIALLGVEARLGDPTAALEAHQRLLDDEVTPLEVPRLALLAALARQRRGDADSAEHAARAFAAYEAVDLLDAAAVHEPAACRILAPPATALGAAVPRSSRRGDLSAPLPEDTSPALLAQRLGLRDREAEVLLALRSGGTNADIAAALQISPATVRKHLQRAYARLGLRSRSEALVLLAGLDRSG